MIEVCIPSVGQEVLRSEKTHTVFKVDVLFNGRKHSLQRRYSEFHALHKRIKKNCKVPDFPPKRVPNWMPKVLEQRRQGLEAYIQGVLCHNQDVPKELLEFLKVKHFQHSSKHCSLDSLTELSSEQNSFLLCHRPVVGFHKDPYVLPSSSGSNTLEEIFICSPFQIISPQGLGVNTIAIDLLPELVVTGVLDGHYRLGINTGVKTGPKVPKLPSPV
ncbi:sorting nexin-22 isoform X2 [Microcaecilia unicolor]|uniref:Sorting nexin-22 isoform X2 n=1 Tax=Microcaecilia unicolor TaxID=1415580 RepID=A0A6P7X046_9AMPH|nr:sorting nexin-22 isoform X2 [Microcaecilia unicolor]